MGLFDIFRKKKKRKIRKKKSHEGSASKISQNITKLNSDIENLQNQIGTLNIILRKHNDEITENLILIEKHTSQIKDLEQLVTERSTNPIKEQFVPANRPNATALEPLSSTSAEKLPQKVNIDAFSCQEKRILGVFFQNRGMALSYADIAQALNKSPNTIKNQMRQINIKANLFTKNVDSDNRNRFKLRESLQIKEYLNTN